MSTNESDKPRPRYVVQRWEKEEWRDSIYDYESFRSVQRRAALLRSTIRIVDRQNATRWEPTLGEWLPLAATEGRPF